MRSERLRSLSLGVLAGDQALKTGQHDGDAAYDEQ